MDVFRFLLAALVAGIACLVLWRFLKGTWRWLAAAVTLGTAAMMFGSADAQAIDSWGVVAGPYGGSWYPFCLPSRS
jgi:hypothetical protein